MSRGVLRLYLGAAPGVGKTYAMLSEGWRRKERGTDVVIGYVETHGRGQTAAQIKDLHILPRKAVEYRDQRFEEMDVDAVIARKPEVALVDELAHTNVPGSRNKKRWQDVEELLDAGITVISTVNVQHLESLNDVVEQITGVTQQETVPDSVVRAADQIELVDMDPDALRRRMAHGNIYASDKIDTALANYFRGGNLTALRELALLWVADRVDEALHDYRLRHGIAQPWETKERVIVTLTGAPGGEDLIRRAARTAMRTKGELVGVHVVSGDGLSGPSTEALLRHRALLEELGGRYREVVSDDVAKALVQAARAENATQLMLGATRRSRWEEILRGSVINRVLRETGAWLDVHVISAPTEDENDDHSHHSISPRLHLAALSRRRQVIGFALALAGLPLLTFVLSGVRGSLGLQNALLCYLLLVVAVATIGGVWPAAVASVLGFVLLNWFFAPPIHTFTIANGRDLLALFAFLVVATVISALVDLAARRRSEAFRARAEANALARMAAMVLRDPDPLPELLDDLVTTFALEGAAILGASKAGWVVEASAGEVPPKSPVEASTVLPLPGEATLALRGPNLRADDNALLNAFAAQLGVAFETRRLQAEAANAQGLTKANELRTALLAAVSHDLRTPLASIKTAATSLLSDDVTFEPAATQVLLETIDEEADRLNALVGNLLDMSRLQTGALMVQAKPVALEEVVALALASLPSTSRIELDVDETLPRVEADAALLERAVANLIDNALAFSPEDLTVRIQAGEVPARRGPNAEPGLRGPNAEPGLRGPNAEPGLRGPNAEPGLRGPNAEPGLRGPNAEPGLRGPNAEPGLRGPNAEPGLRGPNAEPGLRGPNAEPGLRGPNAEPGLRGPNAEPGLRGPNAEPGLRGPNAEHGRVELRIVDRGCGIAVADRRRVFQPFQRLGDSPNGSGVGLGLAVAKGFIEAMGGDLTVDDTPGGGCTMTVSLPQAEL